ncbi:MAG: hypothetical protein RJB66_2067 [Pseudomonadota bacterium]|jgi:TolA-binding protein
MLESKAVKTKKIFIATFTVLGISLSAYAEETIGDMFQKLRKTGGSSAPVMSKEALALPTLAPQVQQQRERVNFNSIKPTQSQEVINVEKYGKDRVELEKITDRQIQELFKITQKMKNSPNRGELWLRLAELYVEKADYIRARRQDEYEEKLALFNQKKISIKPTVDLGMANDYNKKSIQLYEYFIRDFKTDPKMDQALYFLGFNYIAMDDFKKGAGYYARLASEYPKSQYVGEAHFSIGEYYFDLDKFETALDSYKKVIVNKSSRLFGISLYKAAWCYHRLGQSKEGLRYLEVLIRLGAESAKKKVKIAKLDDEARRDLVVFYVEGGDANQALNYFSRILGEANAPKEVEKLAYYYSDKGEKDKGTMLFKQLIALDRSNTKAFDYQYQIVNNYLNLVNTEKFREELYTFVKQYGPKSDWRKDNRENKALMDSSYKTLENFLKTYTLQHHQSAQKSHGKVDQQKAADGYKLYLAEFQDSPNYPDMMFFYGELLYDMERYGEAAQQYAWVAKNAPQSKYGPKAAINMVLGLEKNLPTEQQMQARVGQSTTALELDPRVKQFIENGEWYLKNFQKGDKNVELRFKIGRLYYLSNHFPEAERVFREVVKLHPKSKQAEYASNLLLDMYNLRKDFVGLERVGNELLANEELSQSASAGQIRNILERASFKACEDTEAKKDYIGSAKRYEDFAKKFPKSALVLKAQFNAGVNYQRAGRIMPSVVSLEAVLRNKTKEAPPLHAKAIRLLPKMYQDLGMYQRAALAYVIAGDKNPGTKESQDYYYNAAILYDGLNDVSKAIKNYETYLKTASAVEKPDIYYRMADLSFRNKQYSKAIGYYKEYIKIGKVPDLIVESHFNTAESFSRLNSKGEATNWRTKVVQVQQSLVPRLKGPGARFAAKVKLQNIEQLYSNLTALKFPANTAKMKKVAEQKLELVNKLNQGLAEIVKYDSAEEVVGALELLGRTNAHMNSALMGAPVPPEVTKDEATRQQYMSAVGEMAKPFSSKALESYRGAIAKGRELEAYTSAYFASIEAVRAMDPNFILDIGQEAMPKTYQDWMGFK